MGTIIQIKNPGLLVPTQHNLLGIKLEELVRSYKQEQKRILLPTRRSPLNQEQLVLFDGHHRASYADWRHHQPDLERIEIYAWIAEHKQDLPPYLREQGFHMDTQTQEETEILIQANYEEIEEDLKRWKKRRESGEFIPQTIHELRTS